MDWEKKAFQHGEKEIVFCGSMIQDDQGIEEGEGKIEAKGYRKRKIYPKMYESKLSTVKVALSFISRSLTGASFEF